MQFGRFPRKTILAATLCLAFSAANASFLEQTGTPQALPAAMKTYGVDVSARIGLKAVIPSGWQLFVHRSVTLPDTLSWKVDESWVSVLNTYATSNDIAVLIDWDKKAVYFRSNEVALQEDEKRQMIAEAAATPLPSLKAEPEVVAVAADKVAPGSDSVGAPGATAAVIATQHSVAEPGTPAGATAATTEAVSATAMAVSASVGAVASTTLATAVVAAALAAQPATPVAPAAAPIAAPEVAPVATNASASTSLVVSAASVDSLLDSASKPMTAPTVVSVGQAAIVESASKVETAPVPAPVFVPTPTSTPVVAVTAPASASKTTTDVETGITETVTPLPAAVLSATAAVAKTEVALSAPVSVVTASPAVVVAAAPAPVPMQASVSAAPAEAAPAYAVQTFERPAGEAFNQQAVDEVVRAAADKSGYSMSWEAADVQFPGPVTILGADMGEDMRLVLRALGGRRSPVSIDVYRASNVVRVRNASGAAEVAFHDEPFAGAIREKSVAVFTARPVEAAPRPVPVPHIEVAAQPTPVAVPAVVPVVAPVAPMAVAIVAPTPAVVVAEPERKDTAVNTVKQLGPSLTAAQLEASAPQPQVGDLAMPAPAKVVKANVVLHVEEGASLRSAIEAVLEQGWSLKWELNGDMEANTTLDIGGESIAAVLNKVLPRLSLSADIYKPSKLIVIRPADAALDK